MKNYRLLLMFMVVFLSSCGNQERIHSFDRQVEGQAEKIYKPYTAKSFQNGEIPPNTPVQIRGTITMTDNADGRSIKKNDRFILEAEGERYQIINGSDSEWKLLECVTIYGEYYGFIKAEEIKK